MPRNHPQLPAPVWTVEEIEDAPALTIRQWHERYRTDRDHRVSDRWPDVVAAVDHGLIDRVSIVAIFEASDSNESAADKAISRWLNQGKLLRKGPGVYELSD